MRYGALLLCLGLFAAPGRPQDANVPALPRGASKKTREAIDRGLKFLEREQNRKDGSWRSSGGYGNYPVCMSALCGLALMADGSSPTRGPYAENVRLTVKFILGMQQPNGVYSAPAEESRSMYGHGFGTLFLAQAYGMEEDLAKQRTIRESLDRAIQLIARSQSRDGGWLYTPDSGGDEGSVTVTQVQALRACRNAGLHVPKETIDRAIRYIEKSQNPDGGISYSVRSRGSRPAITAAACAVLYNAGVYDSPAAEKCFAYAKNFCSPAAGHAHGHYFYTQLYMSQACWQKGDKEWLPYYEKIQQYLLQVQEGSGAWNGDSVGHAYGTSIALLILLLPYSNLPILSR